MNDFFISFTVGFLCTVALFCICFLLVLGGRVIFLFLSRYAPQQPQAVNNDSYKKPPRKSTPVPKPVRSIEIDPSKIDRIYVKKSS